MKEISDWRVKAIIDEIFENSTKREYTSKELSDIIREKYGVNVSSQRITGVLRKYNYPYRKQQIELNHPPLYVWISR